MFGFEWFGLFNIENVLVLFVLLVVVVEVGLGSDGSGLVSHFNENYNKWDKILIIKTALFLSLNLLHSIKSYSYSILFTYTLFNIKLLTLLYYYYK